MGLGERRLKEEKEAWRRVLTGCVCFFIYFFIGAFGNNWPLQPG